MKVAVFGAGALGSVYGVRLAKMGGVDVTFVVRPARAASTEPIVIERVRGDARDELREPSRVATVPPDADVVLLAVGTEDLDAIAAPLGESGAPIVILTPMLPQNWERVRAAFGQRAYAAMPNVAAYTRASDGIVRYWHLPAATKIDEPRPGAEGEGAVRELARALSRAKLRGKLELGVHETNPATTVSFIPIAMGLAIAGSARALAEDEALLSLITRACREGLSLSRRIGQAEVWTALTPALAAPWAMRAWLGALGRLSEEAVFYAEEHFGRKLRDQHRVMIREMVELAADKRLPHGALDELQAALR